MDPAVVAALITTPTAVIAATAAYAAGRAQARGAHRGPVDAVRRQHQRDAYAAFTMAADRFSKATHPKAAAVIQAAGEGLERLSREQALSRAEALRRQADITELQNACVVVMLEGPEPVVCQAERVLTRAGKLLEVARHGTDMSIWMAASPLPVFAQPGNHPSHFGLEPLHGAYDRAVRAFVVAARDHLNGDSR